MKRKLLALIVAITLFSGCTLSRSQQEIMESEAFESEKIYYGKERTFVIPEDELVDAAYIKAYMEDYEEDPNVRFSGRVDFDSFYIEGAVDQLIAFMEDKDLRIVPGTYDIRTSASYEKLLQSFHFISRDSWPDSTRHPGTASTLSDLQSNIDSAGLGIAVTDAPYKFHTLPYADEAAPEYPDQHFVNPDTHLYEQQDGPTCSGYTTAYLLRYLDIDSRGEEIYKSLKYKLENGYVLPQGILDYTAALGHPVRFYQGDMDSLRYRLYQSNAPVIAIIGEGFSWQHYVTVVGYDERSVYLFDSLEPDMPDNPYNSVLTWEEFENIWDNGLPYFNHLYLSLI